MNILIVCQSVIPARLYGGTERVVWDLGKELANKGHKISFLVKSGSVCDFARIINLNPTQSINSQIPDDIDIVHLNFPVKEIIQKPNITTIHGNGNPKEEFDRNAVFVSKNHAKRHGAKTFVYNGLNWNNYEKPDTKNKKEYFHFLGNAVWKVKNLKGAIKICSKAKERLYVIGGNRISFKMGIKINLSRNANFLGLQNDSSKMSILKKSKGLIFPVLWDEPFGLAIIESMYMGCPVFGTPYGSLPELVNTDCGYLSIDSEEIVKMLKQNDMFNRNLISDFAADNFNSSIMADNYIAKYEEVLNGNFLNEKKPVMLSNNTFYPFL